MNGKPENRNGVLEEVNPFVSIVVDGKKLPFIGAGFATSSIRLDHSLLYLNVHIDSNYGSKEPQEVRESTYGEDMSYLISKITPPVYGLHQQQASN